MYDLIIVGAGPAGITAGIYAKRYKLNLAIISDSIGGLACEAHLVDNYPGFTDISGMELMDKWKEHATKLGVEFIQENVLDIKKTEIGFNIYAGNKTIETKSIILALGTKQKKLSIPGEDEFAGKGVSYCYTCDGAFFSEKNVAVCGSSNSAVFAALMLSEIASKVYLIFESNELTADPSKIEQINSNNKIEILNNTKITKISGEVFVEKITIQKNKENEQREINLDGVFIEAGNIPSNSLSKKLGIILNEKEYIVVNQAQETNISGIFAAGDITTNSNGLRQIITAASEGAIAANSVFKFIRSKN